MSLQLKKREIESNGAASGTQWLRVPTQALIPPQTTFAICDINIKCPPAIRPRWCGPESVEPGFPP